MWGTRDTPCGVAESTCSSSAAETPSSRTSESSQSPQATPLPGLTAGGLCWTFIAYVAFALTALFSLLLLAAWTCAAPALLLAVLARRCLPFWRRRVPAPYACWTRSGAALCAAEDAAIKAEVREAQWRHSWVPAEVSSHSLQLHALVAWRPDPAGSAPTAAPPPAQQKPTILIIHGTGGSSLSFLSIYDALTHDHDVHCLDLPGFGSSHAPAALHGASCPDVLAFYVESIRTYIESLKFGPVILLAHSFGGFLAADVVAQHPELVSKLILVNAAGVFPTLGRSGAYWAVFFKLSIPQSVVRLLGTFGALLFHVTFAFIEAPPFWYFYYQLLASPAGFADLFVGRFIRTGGMWSWWLYPTLHKLLTTTVPLAFVYGELDDIMPTHQPRALVAASDSRMPVYVVKGAGHAPFLERPPSFITAVLHACREACAPGPGARAVAAALDPETLLSFRSSYNPFNTMQNIDALYDTMLALVPKGAKAGRVFLVDGDKVRLQESGVMAAGVKEE